MKSTRADRRTAPQTTHRHTKTRDGARTAGTFPIVGIGASAGGLEAFSALLKHLPLDTGMGFVLVQHLDPVHESALTQLLGRATSLPVHEVTNNLRVEPNQVYVGIGLTLVRTLTEMHGGSVAVSSAGVGQGSEFVVRLPIAMDTNEPERAFKAAGL